MFIAEGSVLVHFRITAKLGEGGMGVVWRARDAKLGRDVAIKVLPPEMAAEPGRLERFRREAQVVAALNHPNIVTIHSVQEHQGVHFLVLELVEGKTLNELLPRSGLRFAELLELAIPMAGALAAAHEKGIIHRDLKPSNVMLTGEDSGSPGQASAGSAAAGRVKILDFGLAKLEETDAGADAETELLTREGTLLGTMPYMSPEQLRALDVDHRSDIFSLGTMLYEMATGQRPFRGDDPASLISSVLNDHPRPVTDVRTELPDDLGRIVRRCLEKDPDRRFQSAKELRLELEDLLRETPASDRAVLAWRPAPGEAIPHRSSWLVERRLGEGSFGEVWLARHEKTRDPRVFKFCFEAARLEALQREITFIRLLKEELGRRDDIAGILDWNLDVPPYFIESEYTQGGDLRQWTEGRGGLGEVPLGTRLEIVAQMATALAAAHSVGVLHKRLQPENVLITDGPEGEPRVRLTDFGVGEPAELGRRSETGITADEAEEAHDRPVSHHSHARRYTAPEVAEGKARTLQADVYSLGVLLYQMVVGDLSRPLTAGWESDVADELLSEDIAWAVDPSPENRLKNALRIAERLRGLDQRRQELAARKRRRRAAVSIAAAAAIGCLALGWIAGRASAPARVLEPAAGGRFLLDAPGLGELEMITNPSLATDGTMVAYVGRSAEERSLFLRRRDRLEGMPIDGADNASWATFSPDGEWLAYFDGVRRKIMRLSVHGGRPTVLADPGYLPFLWHTDGYLYYPRRRTSTAATAEEGGLVRQRVDGGEPEQLTLAETRGGSGQLQVHSDPKFLPGGRHLLFSVGWGFLQSDWEIAVLDLDTREWRTVFKEANQASYVDGHLVFWRDGRLWAAPFELDTLAVTAPPQPVLDDVDPHPGAPVEVGQFHIGGDGSLVYVGGGELQRGTSHLVLIDEVGASTLATVEGLLTSPRLSPDGRTVAVERCPGGRPAAVDPTSMPCRVWLFELATSAWTPISDPRADLSAPIWHPFGASLVATQLRSSAGRAVVRRDLDGPEDWKVVWSDPNATFVAAVGFARDGRLVLNRAPEPLRSDVLLIGPDSETTTLIGDPTADEFATDLSSDGRWLLYHSNRGGRYEVFLLDLEGPGLAERQLTTEGGQHAVFAPDDASIYYRSASYPEPSEILKAPLDLVDARLGKAETLLETRRPRASRPEALLLGMLEGTETGVLASRREVGAPGGRLILIPGWADELGRRLGTE